MEFGYDRLFHHTVTFLFFILQTVFIPEEAHVDSLKEMSHRSEQQNNYPQHQVYKHLCTRNEEHPFTSEVHKKNSMRCYVSKKRLQTHCEEPALACDEFKNIFKGTIALKFHLRTHTEQQQYTCDVCQKSFSHSSTLK